MLGMTKPRPAESFSHWTTVTRISGLASLPPTAFGQASSVAGSKIIGALARTTNTFFPRGRRVG